MGGSSLFQKEEKVKEGNQRNKQKWNPFLLQK